jgi:WD40 repeat protein
MPPSRPASPPVGGQTPPVSLSGLAALLRSDQQQRWQRGERVLVEDYLRQHPAVRDHSEVAVDLIYSEFLLREQHGEWPDPAEYRRRFPEYAAALERQFALQRDFQTGRGAESAPAVARQTRMGPQAPETVDPHPTASPLDPYATRVGSLAPGQPLVPPVNLPATSPGLPRPEVPGYETLGELGRGGMGVVYQARHRALNRLVALKMVLAGGHARAEELTRFRREGEAVAQLQHPNIVQIYEVGEAEGRPFFSLEFCAAGSLAGRLAGTPLPAEQAARLVETLAGAVQAAHTAGVIHRDLKPANVLLAGEPGAPLDRLQPKVTDFGLAKKLDDASHQTASGEVMGTPSYMAPEQAAGKVKEMGPACDVYSLGAILYECLTGRPPFRAATPWETVRQVIADEPVSPRQLQPKTPRDLETVCLKCLEKEPQRRYASAEELAVDLRRFQAGEPIQARPVGQLERLLKWGRRRPALAGVCVLVPVAVVLFGGVSLAGALWQQSEKARVQLANEKDKTVEALGREQKARDQLAVAQQKLEQVLYLQQVRSAHEAWRDNDVAGAEQRLQSCSPARRQWEYRYVHHLCHADLLTLEGHTAAVRGVAFSRDGSRLATASQDSMVRVWDAHTGEQQLLLKGHGAAVAGVAFSPDGKHLASASEDKTVRVWEIPGGREQLILEGHTGEVSGVAYSPDGKHLASASYDQTLKLWNTDSGEEERTVKGHGDSVTCVAFSPDGKHLASASYDKTVKLWDAQTGREERTFTGHTGWVSGVAFGADGKRLASASVDQTVRVWDAQTGQELLALKGHSGSVNGVACSPDGRRLVSGSEDGTTRVWDAQTGQEVFVLKGYADRVHGVAFSADGRRLASASDDRTVRVWDAHVGPEAVTFGGAGGPVAGVVFSPDGQRLAGAAGLEVRVWDRRTGQETLTLKGHTGAVYGVAFSSDGSRLASASYDRTVKVWDAQTGREQFTLKGHAGEVAGVAFSPDGDRLASACYDQTVKLWDARTGQEVLTLKGHTARVNGVCFSPDGSRLASASGDGTVKVWDAATGQEALTLKGHANPVHGVCFSPDGRRLASASQDQTIKVWDAQTGQAELTLKGHTKPVLGVCFSPDGMRLATASWDRTVRLWDAQTGLEALTLKGHTAWVSGVAFSPDGRRLASASYDKTVRVWDAPPLP